MRLNLYWRGRDVIDIEAHIWRRRREDDDTTVIHASLPVSDASEPIDPDTWAFGFQRAGSSNRQNDGLQNRSSRFEP